MDTTLMRVTVGNMAWWLRKVTPWAVKAARLGMSSGVTWEGCSPSKATIRKDDTIVLSRIAGGPSGF